MAIIPFWAWTVDLPGKWKLLIVARCVIGRWLEYQCWQATSHILSSLGNARGYQLFYGQLCW
ncbi:hypothetical protein [Bradyrhizobium sp. SRS-191]|uniref:hypothetical protein n=1 Tax=Bradyrhizobium sp. SRS-191 TaxID=2962606 RepID=UPI00211F1D57|nr:hypothetical protein [Bradyrhizobium sp. SRS-191]